MPRRIAVAEAVKQHLPSFTPDIIFDVGANVGATAMALATGFPQATIYAFEPVHETFLTLGQNTAAESRIRPFHLALGRRSKLARMRTQGLSVSNRIAGWRDYLKPVEPVKMTSGDRFCAEHGIERIGFLKIDAEGHDLEILFGFQRMLRAMQVDLVEAEVGMTPENRRHVPFEWVKAYLERLDYRLFLIHDQRRDTPFTGRAVVRRGNAVFASNRLIQKSRP